MKHIPTPIEGTYRKSALKVPEAIYRCSGIVVFGKRIKSLVFSTDLAIIKNTNADAIIAVYPFHAPAGDYPGAADRFRRAGICGRGRRPDQGQPHGPYGGLRRNAGGHGRRGQPIPPPWTICVPWPGPWIFP